MSNPVLNERTLEKWAAPEASKRARVNDGPVSEWSPPPAPGESMTVKGSVERDSRAARAIDDLCRIWLVPDGLTGGRWTRRCPIRDSLTCDGGCFRWPRTRIPDGV